MSLARMARFEILKARSRSTCQQIARFAFDANPATFGYEYFYPLLSRELSGVYGVALDDAELSATFSDYESLIDEWRRFQQLRLPKHLLIEWRPRFQEFFPRRLPVDPIKAGMLRFLSFHCFDYNS